MRFGFFIVLVVFVTDYYLIYEKFGNWMKTEKVKN